MRKPCLLIQLKTDTFTTGPDWNLEAVTSTTLCQCKREEPMFTIYDEATDAVYGTLTKRSFSS